MKGCTFGTFHTFEEAGADCFCIADNNWTVCAPAWPVLFFSAKFYILKVHNFSAVVLPHSIPKCVATDSLHPRVNAATAWQLTWWPIETTSLTACNGLLFTFESIRLSVRMPSKCLCEGVTFCLHALLCCGIFIYVLLMFRFFIDIVIKLLLQNLENFSKLTYRWNVVAFLNNIHEFDIVCLLHIWTTAIIGLWPCVLP